MVAYTTRHTQSWDRYCMYCTLLHKHRTLTSARGKDTDHSTPNVYNFQFLPHPLMFQSRSLQYVTHIRFIVDKKRAQMHSFFKPKVIIILRFNNRKGNNLTVIKFIFINKIAIEQKLLK